MRAVQLHRITILVISTVIVWTSMSGCSNETKVDSAPSPEIPAETVQTVSILVPLDTHRVFDAVAAVAETSGQPYDFHILEGNSFEASIQAVVSEKVDLTIGPQQAALDDPVVFFELVRTPVIILIDPELGIDNLTREQAAAIFSGEVTNWSQVGSANMDITVIVQEAAGPATLALRSYLLGARQFAASAQVLFDDRDVITMVNGLPGAIGYSSLATKRMIEESASDYRVMPASLDGLFPNDINYPVNLSVGFVYLPERQADFQALFDWSINFLDSELGQLLETQYGFTTRKSTHD